MFNGRTEKRRLRTMKKTICIAAAITIAFVIAIFAGSGDETRRGTPGLRTEPSQNGVPDLIHFQGC
jgi:hypothetical protein